MVSSQFNRYETSILNPTQFTTKVQGAVSTRLHEQIATAASLPMPAMVGEIRARLERIRKALETRTESVIYTGHNHIRHNHIRP